MKWLQTHRLDLLAILSLILFLAASAILLRSTRITDQYYWKINPAGAPSYGDSLRSAKGIIIFEHMDPQFEGMGDLDPTGWDVQRSPAYFDLLMWKYDGLRPYLEIRFHERNSYYPGQFVVILPDALFLVVFSILPLVRLYYWRRQSRRDGVHCRVCNYDLRASPIRCPECGAPSGTSGP
jgi:hypothetical protein